VAAKPPNLNDLLDLAKAYQEAHLPRVQLKALVLQLDPGPDICLRPSEVRSEGELSVSPDGTELHWFEKRVYYFSEKQGPAVLVLFAAYQSGHPEVPGAKLLTEAESRGERVRDLFKSSAAFTEHVITSPRKGFWKLAGPDDE
jgi:hypothetical protein